MREIRRYDVDWTDENNRDRDYQITAITPGRIQVTTEGVPYGLIPDAAARVGISHANEN
ncbi:hypothetical protein ACIQ7D_17720 [Streptomyces sp. NPDC096310]|uniref:hypothetical protein n=1 Tax=Streptomyces sp. NPDC096310 TaxID=3366082 RepID=UPI0038074A45